jgi:excisionase family DNA binding protein
MLLNAKRSLLSPAEIAELLGVHRASVYRRIQAGELPAIRLGGDGPLRVHGDDLEAWLTQYPARPRGGT